MAVGFDNIDVKLAEDKEIVVTNTPQVLTETTAELGFTLMLTVCNDVLLKRKNMYKMANGKVGDHTYCQVKMFMDSTVGIYGMGDIGKELCSSTSRI